MVDGLNILANGRQPQNFGRWKTTAIFWEMEDDFNILENERRPQHVEQ
jgi:hypothetical protein